MDREDFPLDLQHTPLSQDIPRFNRSRRLRNPEQTDAAASKATWDYKHTGILLELMVRLIDDGYRRGNHLSPMGYNKLIEEFYKRTRKLHQHTQLKSQIDKLRKDWRAWMSIKSPRSSCTGMGWNAVKGTWDAPDSWWSSMAQLNPDVLKFKDKGLDHEELMQKVFHGTTATGEMHWTPSAGQGSAHIFDGPSDGINDENVGSGPSLEGMFETTNDANLEGPSSGSQKRKRGVDDSLDDGVTIGRRRESVGARVSRELGRLATAAEELKGNELHIKYNAPGCDISHCLAKLTTLDGVEVMGPLYIFAAELFGSQIARETFMNLPSDEARVQWLELQRSKHERPYNTFTGSFPMPHPPAFGCPPPPGYNYPPPGFIYTAPTYSCPSSPPPGFNYRPPTYSYPSSPPPGFNYRPPTYSYPSSPPPGFNHRPPSYTDPSSPPPGFNYRPPPNYTP